MSKLAVNIDQKLLDDPFCTLFRAALESSIVDCLADRVEFLDRLASGIHQVENDIKNSTETGGWMGIVSVFSAAIATSAFVTLPIFPIGVLASVGAASALAGVGSAVHRKVKLSPVAEKLERHYLALKSTEIVNWASLWDYSRQSSTGGNGDEVFLYLLEKASQGSVDGNQLTRRDDIKQPFAAAIKAAASRQGRKPEDIAAFVRAIKEAFLAGQPSAEVNLHPVPQSNRPNRQSLGTLFMAQQSAIAPSSEPRPAIGANTRINAVSVPAEEIKDAPSFDETIDRYLKRSSTPRDVEQDIAIAQSMPEPEPAIAPNPWEKPTAEPVNPIDILGDKLSSLLLIAPTGGGKGILISNLIRHFHKSEQGLKVFAFEGKNDPNESGYWAEGFEEVARVNLDTVSPVEAARAIVWIVEQIDAHHERGIPSILLIDEANTLITVLENGSKYGTKEDKEECGLALGLVKKKISTSASTGNSAQKYVWVIGQNPNLSALGLNGGDANQLRKVAIAYHRNPTLTDQIVLATGYTGKKQDADYRRMIDDLIEASPVDRAFYDSARAQKSEYKGWFPMERMTNYSGYDRDSHKHINQPEPAPEPDTSDVWGATEIEVKQEPPNYFEQMQDAIAQSGYLHVSALVQAFSLSEAEALQLATAFAYQNRSSGVRFDAENRAIVGGQNV